MRASLLVSWLCIGASAGGHSERRRASTCGVEAAHPGLLEYDARHGYRGSERHVASGEATVPPEKVLADIADVGGLVPAVVTSVDESTAGAWARDVGPVELDFERMRWARPCIDENRRDNTPKGAAQALRRTLE